ncbi:NAD(P)-dependent oxidoreductase [Pedobacter sp. B4-66]|uniref:NAD-dependent epimerase/dehydratase family protein n=1 Tax=Pedobacter sp. B4-66 TaxID=2817280 RepID=UPI001BDAC894|nr:NAD(P)-dependent oxidoreductase [Pedobacter sp. B4-66]
MNRPEILIVGINNFLGIAIFNLLKDTFNIIGVYNHNTDKAPQCIELVQVEKLSTLKGREFSHIYLISSYVPGLNKPNDDQKLIDANILLPRTIIDLFPESRIIFCSSVSIYENRTKEGVILKSEPPSPKSKYAISKLWGEEIVKESKSYAIIRISSMFGAGMNKDTFLPKVMEKALLFGEIILLGEGERMQNYIHVVDVANIAVKAALHPINTELMAVSNSSYSNKEIAQMIIELIPETSLNFSGSDSSKSFVYDNSFTFQELGQMEFKNIKEGLKELKEWIKKEY